MSLILILSFWEKIIADKKTGRVLGAAIVGRVAGDLIAEFALGKRSRAGTVGTFRMFTGKNYAWMGLWTAWISTAIGFYYAIVAGWCMKYFTMGATGGLAKGTDFIAEWNHPSLSKPTDEQLADA